MFILLNNLCDCFIWIGVGVGLIIFCVSGWEVDLVFVEIVGIFVIIVEEEIDVWFVWWVDFIFCIILLKIVLVFF